LGGERGVNGHRGGVKQTKSSKRLSLQVDQLLPLSTPALSSLQALELADMPALGTLPISVARALPRLTSLSLTTGAFRGIPLVVSHLTGLNSLDLTGNPIQLTGRDVGVLAALPHLRSLGLSRKGWDGAPDASSGFWQSSVGVLIKIGQRWPHLDLHGF